MTAKILGRSKRLVTSQRKIFDKIFHSGDGYVLDFSDKTMSEWFEESFGFNIFQEKYQAEGSSKGKTLRGFVEVADPRLVAKVLRTLFTYRGTLPEHVEDNSLEEAMLRNWMEQFTRELDDSSTSKFEDALRDFSDDTSLPKLRASIENDIVSGNPDVALDRVHTYCVKRFRTLISKRGESFDKFTPLHSLFGIYGRLLKEDCDVTAFALPALRSQHKLMESFGHIRNDRSLAHDNELLPTSEARFVVDAILNLLAFVERLESASSKSVSDEKIN